MMRIAFVVCCFFVSGSLLAQKGFSLIEKPAEKKVEVRFDGKFVTAYCYFDSTEKPVLFPVKTLSGITVTRGFPIAPRKGERTDHPHHVGIWFNYESVNGLDFWNNSYAIPQERKPHYGSVKHQKVLSKQSKGKEGSLTTLSHWVDQQGKVLLEETTYFTFSVDGNNLIIDRKAVLKAVDELVEFKDVKDGLLAIRVARGLELPSQQEDKFIDNNGIETTVPALNSEGVTGMYINEEGVRGDEVWSTRSSWVQMYGELEGKKVSVVILDHPSNIGFPTYWHARGYGLFAANPLGAAVFSQGKEKRELSLQKGKTVEFKYRIVIHEGPPMTSADIDPIRKSFAQK